MSSSLTTSAPIAMRAASMNVAENVPRLTLLAMDASVSCIPCFFMRSASSRYPTSARFNSAFRNRFARSSQGRDFVAIGILSILHKSYRIRYLSIDKPIIIDIVLPHTGELVMLDVFGQPRQQRGLE